MTTLARWLATALFLAAFGVATAQDQQARQEQARVGSEWVRKPFQFVHRQDWVEGSLGVSSSFQVPKDKRLVIETVTAGAEVPVGQELTGINVFTVVAGVRAEHIFTPVKIANFENVVDIYKSTAPVRLYADAGTRVDIGVVKNIAHCPFPCGTTQVTISGYLLDPRSPLLSP